MRKGTPSDGFKSGVRGTSKVSPKNQNLTIELKTLILDLGETLVHSEPHQPGVDYELVLEFPGQGPNGKHTVDVCLNSILTLIENRCPSQALLLRVLGAYGGEVRVGDIHCLKADLCRQNSRFSGPQEEPHFFQILSRALRRGGRYP